MFLGNKYNIFTLLIPFLEFISTMIEDKLYMRDDLLKNCFKFFDRHGKNKIEPIDI